MNIKGLIKRDGEHYLTCCHQEPRILIDGYDLHESLKNFSELTNPTDDNGYSKNEPKVEWKVRYCVRETPFDPSEDFETVSAEIINASLESDEVNGCYSEWTCGYGDYTFVLNGGHSIFNELAQHDGKYVWLEI